MSGTAASASRSSRGWFLPDFPAGSSGRIPWISTCSRSGTNCSIPSVSEGGRTTSSSAMIIRPGTWTFCSIVPLCSQLRVKLRYQLMPPVKPVLREGVDEELHLLRRSAAARRARSLRPPGSPARARSCFISCGSLREFLRRHPVLAHEEAERLADIVRQNCVGDAGLLEEDDVHVLAAHRAHAP